jgi:hypothetical protein
MNDLLLPTQWACVPNGFHFTENNGVGGRLADELEQLTALRFLLLEIGAIAGTNTRTDFRLDKSQTIRYQQQRAQWDTKYQDRSTGELESNTS